MTKPTTPCREWTGARTKAGYGRIFIRRGVEQRAHRAAWEAAHGPIPAGKVVMHRCDNPPCVRIDHLELGTQRDNMDDMRSKRRARYRIQIDEETVAVILSSPLGNRPLSRQLGISHAQVGVIRRGLRRSATDERLG